MPDAPPTIAQLMRRRRAATQAAERYQRKTDPAQHHIDTMRRSGRWKNLRRAVLDANPLCVQCEREGRATPATEVDHVLPLALRPDLAFTRSNLQPLCAHHHARKSARERAR